MAGHGNYNYAMAATATISKLKVSAVGDRIHSRCTVTESGTYSAGGTPITAAALGLKYIEAAFPSPVNAAGISVAWNQTPGTSINILTYDEDNTSGVEAQFVGTAAAVYSLLVVGF